MRTFHKRMILGAALCLLLCGCGIKREKNLTVVFPRLGAADCAVFMTKSATILIDTGESGDAEEILTLLSRYDRNTIDLLLISHYDKDHVGGAAKLLSNLTVKRVIGSSSPKGSEEYVSYIAALADAGLLEEIPKETLDLTLGDMKLTVYPPERESYSENQSNNSSVVVSVEYQDTHFLFTGDAMAERLGEIMPTLSETGIVYDVIKIPHHGRDTSDAKALVEALGDSDTACLITSSKKEPEAEEILTDLPCPVYLTRKGTVTAVSDGTEVTVTQE